MVHMLDKFVKKLFHFQGSQNPKNLEQVVKDAFIILHDLEKEDCVFNGTSGSYNPKKGWMKNPKLSITHPTDGRTNINLDRPSSPIASKFLIAVLYSIAYLKNKIQSAELFYEDKQGPKQSIASRHGPEKSDYMKSMISKMNDESFLNELEQFIEKPLPDHLTEVQRSLLGATEQGVVSQSEVQNIMKTHDIEATELMREYERLKVILGQDMRIPDQVVVPEIDLIKHEEQMQNIVEVRDRKIGNLETDIARLNADIDSLNSKLNAEIVKGEQMQNRGLIARILNRKK